MIIWVAMIMVMATSVESVCAQGFNGDKVAFTRFVTRMYDNNPFEGVKVVDDYDDIYLISVVSLSPSNYPSESTMTRVAEVKARAQASRYINGADISLDMVVTTKDNGKGNVSTELVEKIHERSIGYVGAMELLTIIPKESNNVYIYATTRITND